MKNLLKHLEDAQSSKNQWSAFQTEALLESLCKASCDARCEWEEGDEMWARVILGDEVIAIVSAEMPLVILRHAHQNLADSAQLDRKLVRIAIVQKFDEPVMRTTRFEIEQIFNRLLSGNIDYENLSINDLWWATVH